MMVIVLFISISPTPCIRRTLKRKQDRLKKRLPEQVRKDLEKKGGISKIRDLLRITKFEFQGALKGVASRPTVDGRKRYHITCDLVYLL
jgi:hypothetical protein